MAVIKTSVLADEIKGAIGGTVFQFSKWGQIAKSKSSGGPTSSAIGRLQQSNIGFAVQAWRDLDENDRKTWTSNAALYPTTDRFGNSVVSSGYNLFLRVALQLSKDQVKNLSSLPLVDSASGGWTAAEVPTSGQLKVTLTRDTGNAYTVVFLYASPQYNPWITAPRKRDRRVLRLYNIRGSLTSDVASQYVDAFGTIENGKNIFFTMEAKLVNSAQTVGSSSFIISTVGF